ncbi:MAG: hypothetical protein FD147_196 [Chloroflexi bacterium]|nr:MAG: hypothetical protein FD147_196 [Chloroflexota bacterium]MBA4374758.1 hypothetical protein [Anaerolinea sp.]
MNFDDLSPAQQEIVRLPLQTKVFLHGQAGSGKTTAAIHRMLGLIDQGIPAESVLVLVPQRSLAQGYRDVIRTPNSRAGGEPAILTIGGLAQRMIALFWPIVAKNAGFKNPTRPPQFLTLETAQYYLASIVEPLLQKGYFESVTVDPNRLYSQILDNLNKSAVVGFAPDEISQRLIQAWAGKASQSVIYEQAQECALLFRKLCLQQDLLDFSLQLSIFTDHLWTSFLCKKYLTSTYRHLIYDNAEEDYPVAHDIIAKWLPDFESALILSDTEAGFRSFMGADPVSANSLGDQCSKKVEFCNSLVKTHPLDNLESALSRSLIEHRLDGHFDSDVESSFSIHPFRFYPQVIDWIVKQVSELLINQNVTPNEIVILTPFLSDSLRFSFYTRFTECGIPINTFRPSRSLRDEPAVKTVITLAKLAYPIWALKPSKDEVRTALMLTITDCDYVRADLLTQILYSSASGSLRSFDPVKKEMQQRLTYTIGERYEKLRRWLEQNSNQGTLELDFFLSKLFGEILSQPGFKFHENFDSASSVNRLIESCRKFRQTMTDGTLINEASISKEYIRLVDEGILAAQYLSDWAGKSQSDSVLISPAFSFLMSNRPAKYQFWLDIGSQGWWTRLDQPLTHPYVLNRNWARGQLWTDAQEYSTNQKTLARVTTGLIRRCSDHIFMCSIGINEQGNEERGALVMAIQTILRKLKTTAGGKHV